jgi:hypothetical protein
MYAAHDIRWIIYKAMTTESGVGTGHLGQLDLKSCFQFTTASSCILFLASPSRRINIYVSHLYLFYPLPGFLSLPLFHLSSRQLPSLEVCRYILSSYPLRSLRASRNEHQMMYQLQTVAVSWTFTVPRLANTVLRTVTVRTLSIECTWLPRDLSHCRNHFLSPSSLADRTARGGPPLP